MRKADNLSPYRAVVMKSGSLNFLEPSGPAQACYGRTLLFTKRMRVTEVYVSLWSQEVIGQDLILGLYGKEDLES